MGCPRVETGTRAWSGIIYYIFKLHGNTAFTFNKVLKMVQIKLDLLRLWLSFFCLSFISALVSASERQIHSVPNN